MQNNNTLNTSLRENQFPFQKSGNKMNQMCGSSQVIDSFNTNTKLHNKIVKKFVNLILQN